jgi:hypothetical protein
VLRTLNSLGERTATLVVVKECVLAVLAIGTFADSGYTWFPTAATVTSRLVDVFRGRTASCSDGSIHLRSPRPSNTALRIDVDI